MEFSTLLVPKKDSSNRPVIDFCKVNALTVTDQYLLPVLSELLQSIGKHNTVFSSLGLLSGFWEIPMEKKSGEITEISTPSGHNEWLRLPMGLRNAPFTFQRMINSLLSSVVGKGLHLYRCLKRLGQSSSAAFPGLPEANTSRSQSQAH